MWNWYDKTRYHSEKVHPSRREAVRYIKVRIHIHTSTHAWTSMDWPQTVMWCWFGLRGSDASSISTWHLGRKRCQRDAKCDICLLN
jgi:hypothetical protein